MARRLLRSSKEARIRLLKRKIRFEKEKGVGALIGAGGAGAGVGALIGGPVGVPIGFVTAEILVGSGFERIQLRRAGKLKKRLRKLRVRRVKNGT